MRLGRFGVALTAVGALAVVLSGCVVFQGPVKVKQKGSKPKAIVTFKVCLSDSHPKLSVCEDLGNSDASAGVDEWRVLVGLRYTKGAKAPGSIEPKSFETGTDAYTGSTVLDKDSSYTAELKEKAPGNPSKYKWVGYVSEPIHFSDDFTYGATANFRIKLDLKDKLIGEKLKVRPVVGIYQLSFSQPANGPIDCGDNPFARRAPGTVAENYEDGTFGICIDSPAPDEFTNAKVKIEG